MKIFYASAEGPVAKNLHWWRGSTLVPESTPQCKSAVLAACSSLPSSFRAL